MAKKKKNILAMPDKNIGFEELKQVRETEMEGVLPGYFTRITLGNKEALIESPSTFDRTLFNISQ